MPWEGTLPWVQVTGDESKRPNLRGLEGPRPTTSPRVLHAQDEREGREGRASLEETQSQDCKMNSRAFPGTRGEARRCRILPLWRVRTPLSRPRPPRKHRSIQKVDWMRHQNPGFRVPLSRAPSHFVQAISSLWASGPHVETSSSTRPSQLWVPRI